jgi:multidrug efflux pump subunit AcrA (membrane-fusion protein)
VRRGSLAGVFVIDAEHARLRWLKLGRESAGRVEVLSGLAPGETYALDPRGLGDGGAVEVRGFGSSGMVEVRP